MYGNIIQDQFARALNWPLGSLMSFVMLLLMLALILPISRFARFLRLGGL